MGSISGAAGSMWKSLGIVQRLDDSITIWAMCALINGYWVNCVNTFKDRKSQQREFNKNSALHFNVNVGSYDKYLNGLVRWFHKNGLLHTGINDVINNN